MDGYRGIRGTEDWKASNQYLQDGNNPYFLTYLSIFGGGAPGCTSRMPV